MESLVVSQVIYVHCHCYDDDGSKLEFRSLSGYSLSKTVKRSQEDLGGLYQVGTRNGSERGPHVHRGGFAFSIIRDRSFVVVLIPDRARPVLILFTDTLQTQLFAIFFTTLSATE